tara:strand:- start:275 stop:535 length:261 start_codon:yes stop_codon:yes gene_type:complete
MYRLQIDIPLGHDEESAIATAESIMRWHFLDSEAKDRLRRLTRGTELTEANYRLGHDEDRQRSNYLDKNENGHVSTKKCRIDMENS